MLQRKVECFEKMILISARSVEVVLSRAASSKMTTQHIRTNYEEVQKEVKESRDNGNVWVENSDGNVESFVGSNQLFCD